MSTNAGARSPTGRCWSARRQRGTRGRSEETSRTPRRPWIPGSPLLVFDASVELTSSDGVRSVALAEFFQGPGKTTRAPSELVTAVDVPPLPVGRVGSAYLRLEYRQAMEIAVVGAAALLALDAAGSIVEGRVALTAVAPVCLRVPEAERLLAGAARHR